MSGEKILTLWSSSPAVSVVIWVVLLIVVLYIARWPAHRQRRYRTGVLARYVQRLPAGGNDGDFCCPAQQDIREHGARVQQMLAGVENDQYLTIVQVLKHHVQPGPGVPFCQAQAGRDGVRQKLGIPQAGQLDQAGAVGEAVSVLTRGPQRDASLADTPRSGDGDQPGGGQQAAKAGQLTLPPDEPSDLYRERTGTLPH